MTINTKIISNYLCICQTAVFSILFTASFNLSAQQQVIFEKLNDFSIPERFMEHTIRNAERKYTFKYKLSTVDADRNPFVSVAEYDPRRKKNRRWELLSINGGEPAPKGVKEFNRINNVKRQEATGRIDSSSYMLVEDSDRIFSFSFTYEAGSITGYRKYLEDCTGLVEIDKSTGEVINVRFKNTSDTKVRMFRCTSLEVDLDLQYMKETDLYVIKNEKSRMTVMILGNEVEIEERGEYYDYQLIDQ